MSHAGIYQIKNNINNKRYIGQTIRPVYLRLREHYNQLERNNHSNHYLQNAWNKYGRECFSFDVLEYCDINLLNIRECFYIDLYDTQNRDKGYNIEGGGNSRQIILDETRQKISKNHCNVSGKNNPMYNKHHTEEAKQKISAKNTGKRRTQDEKIKSSMQRTSTGFYRVYRHNKKTLKQGYACRYQYYDNNHQRKTIESTSLFQLRDKVLKNGLIWKIIDEAKAHQSILFEKQNKVF